jgi:hypothetical protein
MKSILCFADSLTWGFVADIWERCRVEGHWSCCDAFLGNPTNFPLPLVGRGRGGGRSEPSVLGSVFFLMFHPTPAPNPTGRSAALAKCSPPQGGGEHESRPIDSRAARPSSGARLLRKRCATFPRWGKGEGRSQHPFFQSPFCQHAESGVAP